MNPVNVDLFTTRFGGPLTWARHLADHVEAISHFRVRVHHRPFRLLSSPFYAGGEIVHSVLPITFRFWKKPLILTVKGDFRKEDTPWSRFYPASIARADCVTVPSEYLRRELGLSNALIIPNAVDISSYPNRERKPKAELVFLTVTKFWFREKAYGVLRLAENFEKATSSMTVPPRMYVLGEGRYLKEVSSAVRKISRRIEFLGSTNPRKYLDESDVFLYSSFHDNMPNAVLEAMTASLPIVTNRVGAIPEMIDDGVDGLIADDDESFQRAIVRLATDAELRGSLGGHAYLKVKEKFNWDVIAPSYIRLYEQFSRHV